MKVTMDKPIRRRKETPKEPEFVPRTALGRKLWAFRQKILKDGTPLLSYDEILAEKHRNRGGSSDE